MKVALAEKLVFSDNPSARAQFPGGVTITRKYDLLEAVLDQTELEETQLPCPGSLVLKDYQIICTPAEKIIQTQDCYTVRPVGTIWVRARRSGDAMRLSGGTKSLKKLFVDRKIPAAQRLQIPVICDDAGILGVYSIGANMDRAAAELPAVTIQFIKK